MFEELCLLFLVLLPLGAKYFEWERKGGPLTNLKWDLGMSKVCLHFSCNKTLFNKFTKTGKKLIFNYLAINILNIVFI